MRGRRRRTHGFHGWRPAGTAKATAYATFDRHMNGDMKPYVFKTNGFRQILGATADRSQRRAGLRARNQGRHGGCQPAVPRHRIRSCGSAWMAGSDGRNIRGADFPSVAVRDLVVHPRTSDLILATHGRGIWIIDDISRLARSHARRSCPKRRGSCQFPRRRSGWRPRRLAGGRCHIHRAAPADGRFHSLLPAHAPHLRRPEDRDLRRRRQIWWTRSRAANTAASIAPRGPCI